MHTYRESLHGLCEHLQASDAEVQRLRDELSGHRRAAAWRLWIARIAIGVASLATASAVALHLRAVSQSAAARARAEQFELSIKIRESDVATLRGRLDDVEDRERRRLRRLLRAQEECEPWSFGVIPDEPPSLPYCNEVPNARCVCPPARSVCPDYASIWDVR